MQRRTADGETLFTFDLMLPEQFYATLQRQAVKQKGERQLLVAVLEDAVTAFQKYACVNTTHGRRLFAEAEHWLMSDDRSVPGDEGPSLTFAYVCEVLGLDPAYLRRGLRLWHEARSAEIRGQSSRGSQPHEPETSPA